MHILSCPGSRLRAALTGGTAFLFCSALPARAQVINLGTFSLDNTFAAHGSQLGDGPQSTPLNFTVLTGPPLLMRFNVYVVQNINNFAYNLYAGTIPSANSADGPSLGALTSVGTFDRVLAPGGYHVRYTGFVPLVNPNLAAQGEIDFEVRVLSSAAGAPEPGTLALLTLGMVGGILARRKK